MVSDQCYLYFMVLLSVTNCIGQLYIVGNVFILFNSNIRETYRNLTIIKIN